MAIKQQTFALSQFWREDVWNQDISKAATEPARSGRSMPQLERPCAPMKDPTWYSKDPTCCSWDPMKANKHLNGFILKDHLLKTWHWQGHTPCGASMGESLPCPHSLTWGLEAVLLQSLPPHFCLCQNSLCFSFIKTLQIHLFLLWGLDTVQPTTLTVTGPPVLVVRRADTEHTLLKSLPTLSRQSPRFHQEEGLRITELRGYLDLFLEYLLL